MKNILVVFTGGTICTTIHGGTMSTDPTATAALIELYRSSTSPCKGEVNLVPGKCFNILSENMTVDHWNRLIDYFQQILLEGGQYQGIIIAHGTDTLAYSAALFSQLLKGIDIPVLFVSSNHPILDSEGHPNPEANGCENFRAAVECIHQGLLPGVYATYQNPEDGKTYLHKGAHLIQCAIYDENFYSRDMQELPDIPTGTAPKPTALLIQAMGDARLVDCILKVTPYVGLNYEMLDPTKARAVLHGTYHSGTACVETDREHNSILYLSKKCEKAHVPFYYAPAMTDEEATVYASVPKIQAHKSIRFHYGMTEELLYAKLLLAYSLGWTQEKIDEFLKEE